MSKLVSGLSPLIPTLDSEPVNVPNADSLWVEKSMKRQRKPSHDSKFIDRTLRGLVSEKELVLEINLALDFVVLSRKARSLTDLANELRKSSYPSAPYAFTLLELLRMGFAVKDESNSRVEI